MSSAPSPVPDSDHFRKKRFEKYKKQSLTPQEIKKKEEQRCIRLVLIGNFLEYYDLYLFIHLTFILNPMFLPPGDPSVEIIGKVFMFCSAYLTRPLGSLFWGWIGDRFGRTFVLNNTMTLMGIASMAITTVPTYEKIGIWSAVLVILCRFVQGFAAGGEVQAASVYIAESSKEPLSYYRDGLHAASSSFGQLFAGALATFFLFFFPTNGWMVPFWIGSLLAILGVWARQALHETPSFIHALQRYKKKIPEDEKDKKKWEVILTLFFLYSMTAASMIFYYGYCPEQLSKLGLSPARITAQTTVLAGIMGLSELFWGYIVYKTNKPFLIFKWKAVVFSLTFLCLFSFSLPQSLLLITFIQFAACLESGPVPLTPLFIKYFSVLSRCRTMMLTWSITKAIMYFVTTYLAFWLSQKYDQNAVLGMILLFSFAYVFAAFRAEKLLKNTK